MNDEQVLLKKILLSRAGTIPATFCDVLNISPDKQENVLIDLLYAYGIIERGVDNKS